jgi:hypothetical protein
MHTILLSLAVVEAVAEWTLHVVAVAEVLVVIETHS